MIYVPGKGPLSPRLMIVGDRPSYDDTLAQKPFTGAGGREIEKVIRDAGINIHDAWLTNVCKYHIPHSNEKIPLAVLAERAGININQQIEEFQTEVNSIKPNCILALGGFALWALTGKKSLGDYRGSILSGMGRKVVATYNPADLIRHKNIEFKGYWNRQIMVFDAARALKQSAFPEINRPSRILSVCKSSAQLANFLERHANATTLALDIEALECIPGCIGLAFSSHEGLCIPFWNCRGVSNISDSDLTSIWILLARVLQDPRYKKIGQNFKYDQDKISRLGFPIDRLHADTMLKAFTINPELPVNLAFNTSIYTEEPFYKNEGMYQGSTEDLMIGCARDACVTYEINEKQDGELKEIEQEDFYYNFINHLHELYLHIEEQGFRVDPVKRDELMVKYISWREQNQYKLYKMIGDNLNVASPKQVALLLYGTLKIPFSGGTDEEKLTQIINSPRVKDAHKDICSLILEQRRVRKTISTYLMALPDFDGRMRTTYFLCLKTGRTATGQQEPPIRPSVKIDKKDRVLGLAFQTMTKHGDIGGDFREEFIADDGEVIINADSSQAEARVVFRLARDEQALHDLDKHDYHALTASWFFGGTEESYSKKILGYEHPIRFAGKTLRHAGHLGAGKKRAATELNTQARKNKIPIQITEAQAGKALEVFHKKQPAIQGVFHADVIAAINKSRILIAPLPYGIKSKYGGRRTFFERAGEDLYRESYSYIPQRAVSDNTKAAALRIRERAPWIRILVEAHDALTCSVPISRLEEAALIIKEEMERPIDFSNCSLPRESLSIPCDVEFGYNYKHLDKFKFSKPVTTATESFLV